MKKLLIILVLIAFTACKEAPINVDYDCYVDFNVKNGTEADIIVITDGLRGQTIIIGSEEEKTVYYLWRLCGEGYIPSDRYSTDEWMLGINMTINGETMPHTIWQRGLWEFTNKTYQATYTLTITDELIESLKSK